MTQEEFLFVKLGEEANEVGQRVAKLLQFGPNEIQEGQLFTNLQRLRSELNDFQVSVLMLQEAEFLPVVPHLAVQEAITERKARVAKYLERSKSLGRVREYESTQTNP